MPRISRRKSTRYNRKRKTTMMRRRRSTNKLRRQVHMFKRIVNLGSYTAKTTYNGVGLPNTDVPVMKAFSFQLNDLPNASEYNVLFDQYKITGIKLRVIPKAAMTTQGSSTGTIASVGYGQVVSVIDYDDADTPTSKDQLLEFGSAKVTSVSRIHQRYFKPKILNQVYINSISTGYSPVRSNWLDNSYPTIQHYGLKLWIDAPQSSNNTTSSSISYDVYATYYFMCKNTR